MEQIPHESVSRGSPVERAHVHEATGLENSNRVNRLQNQQERQQEQKSRTTYHGAEKKTRTGLFETSFDRTIVANCSSDSIIFPPVFAICSRVELHRPKDDILVI
jgi:hypothetical protein